MKDFLLRASKHSPAPEPKTEVQNYPTRPLSIAELCQWASVSRRFVELEIERGNLPVRKLSNRLIRILPGDVRVWLDRASTEVA